MNADRLQKLRERADQAVKLGRRIESIGKLDSPSMASSWRRNTSMDDACELLDLQMVVTFGKRALIEMLDKELEGLIAVEPEPPVKEESQ